MSGLLWNGLTFKERDSTLIIEENTKGRSYCVDFNYQRMESSIIEAMVEGVLAFFNKLRLFIVLADMIIDMLELNRGYALRC